MFEPGTQVGRYEIQRRLGRGGMGTVYVAHDPVLGRMVAIKVFAGDLDVPDARERFSREARAAAALNHPHIVTIYDFGEFDSQPFIVMEYVTGETMANVIRRKVPVSMADKLRWMEELCAGAGYAHQMSVVHRDIKPANLMIDRAGRLKILDFGIARMLGIASNTSVMIGTPGYMAPEQITGDPVDHRSDQFSIGVVFYELLAYTEPFPGDTLPMITHRIVSEEPAALDQLVPELSPDLVAIIGQALKKKNAERFKDAETMRNAIARVRRHYETDGDWPTQTMSAGHDLTPTGSGSRGTGSARRRSNESVGVAQLTPPPDPRRTDREALARRRTLQLDAALLLARTLFEQRDLDAALDACEQALTLDETHEGAIELEQEIQTAIRARDGVEIVPEDAAVTTASDPFSYPGLGGRMLESQAVTRFTDPSPAATGLPAASPGKVVTSAPSIAPSMDASGVIDPTVMRPAVVPHPEATIIAPARRTPPPVPAQPSASARVAPPVAKAPSTPAKASKVVAKKTERAPVLAPAMKAVASAVQAIGPAVSGVSKVQMWAVAGIVALAVVGGAAFMLTRGPAPTGTAIIDAVPWANVVSVRNESGDPQLLPTPASTPLSLVLPVGTYRITLAGPPPESKTETVSVRIEVGGLAVVPVPRFQGVTVEEYFEQYLGGGDAPAATPPAAAPADTSAPAAAPAPAGVQK